MMMAAGTPGDWKGKSSCGEVIAISTVYKNERDKD